MKTILVTGPIGSGKSAFCQYVASLGYPVYDCDSRCKALYEEVPGLKTRIEETLGVDFSRIGIIFSDPLRRQALEALVYPELVRDINAWRTVQTADLLFLESAIALQKPQLDGLYDRVLLITAPYDLRLARNSETARRDALQAFPMERVDAVLHNDGSLADFRQAIDRWLEAYIRGDKLPEC